MPRTVAAMRALILALLLSGCAVSPTAQGEWPARPADHAAASDRYLAATLKDPGSVQTYQLSEPGMCQMPGFGARWCACVVVNAKNSYGGYTGAKRHLLVYVGDGVHSMLPDGAFSYTAEYCNAWGAQPRDPAAITASQSATSPGPTP